MPLQPLGVVYLQFPCYRVIFPEYVDREPRRRG